MVNTPRTQTGGGATERRASVIAPGQVLAGRYEVRRLLGRGGMGEVWLAFDLKLRVDVALKDLAFVDRNIDLVRREVRAAREVMSPNVCRIFDLVEADGRELVSMEYVDGRTLRQILDGGPMEIAEAQPLASQFLAGLEAIHAANLVHRDLKPENVMLTRTGRVVIMDFGLAHELSGANASVAGTPAYMAPEQIAGEALDARTDVFAAGLVLAEMITPRSTGGVFDGVRRAPADSPWFPVLRKAIATARSARFDSASALARALDEVGLRAIAGEQHNPYPGLAAFTADQSKYFFGREAEIESLLRKLERYQLLAVIGPSGVGKTSFLQAGVLPMLPASWGTLFCRPGSSPFVALGQALAAQLSDEANLAREMVAFHETGRAIELLKRWRAKHVDAVIVVDQFEELFTLNAEPVQAAFASLLGHVVAEGDIRVVVSLRDDFVFQCNRFDALKPLFSELSPLDELSGSGLRRALVQPAALCGYRFEDESLVHRMLTEAGEGRGALPLIAFAAAQLWERRDRTSGRLTIEEYDHIGGVSGALARHAEATMHAIGTEHEPIVREIFRNLVTAQGTRAARADRELLSLFPSQSHQSARRVLDTLISARLLTTFVTDNAQVEIVHESLLTKWPRLVRWQAQDAEGALMRDHVRQAADLWQQRGRPAELLWTGNALREFVVWRSRYRGALTESEQTFAEALISNAERRRRRVRAIAGSIVIALVVVAATMAVLWRRASASEQRARAEGRNAEAQKLLALSQLELERYPTAALAYAMKSLEIADTPDVRRRVMEILWRGPIARVLPLPRGTPIMVKFSDDGNWLAGLTAFGSDALIRRDGAIRTIPNPATASFPAFDFTSDNRFLAVQGEEPQLHIFSVGNAIEVATIPNQGGRFAARRSIVTATPAGQNVVVKEWPLPSGAPATLGALRTTIEDLSEIDPARRVYVSLQGNVTYEQSIEQPFKRREIWRSVAPPRQVRLFDDGKIVTVRTKESLAVLSKDRPPRSIALSPVPEQYYRVPADATQSTVLLARADGKASHFHRWDLDGPHAAETFQLRWPEQHVNAACDPTGAWLVTSGLRALAFWPARQRYARVIRHDIGFAFSRKIVFTPDSKYLYSCGNTGGWHAWSANDADDPPWNGPPCSAQAMNGDGTTIVMGGTEAMLLSTSGRSRKLLDAPPGGSLIAVAVDRGGKTAVLHFKDKQDANKDHIQIRVVDLTTGSVKSFAAQSPNVSGRTHRALIRDLAFGADGSLYSAGVDGIRQWDVNTGTSRIIRRANTAKMAMSGDGRVILAALGIPVGQSRVIHGDLVMIDLASGTEKRLEQFGTEINDVAIDTRGDLIGTMDALGVIRLGRPADREPHLIVGETDQLFSLAFSPDHKWVASSTSTSIDLWPMPDLSKPPLHTLPHEQLLANLRTLTNVRAVPDNTVPSGYRIDVGRFPGWKDNPDW